MSELKLRPPENHVTNFWLRTPVYRAHKEKSVPRGMTTVQRHILEQERAHPGSSGELTSLLWDLTIAAKVISHQVNRGGLGDIFGETGEENVTGDLVRRLDRIAQDTIYRAMDHGGHLCVMVSEESPEMIPIPARYPKGKYVLLYDPLDGSSNIDANVSIGTIFSVHRRVTASGDGTLEDCLRPGSEQVAAGYFLYGSSTMIVYTTGQGVYGFTLEPSVGEFLLSHESIMTPPKGKYYSINEGNRAAWDEPTRRYIDYLKEKDKATGRPYSLRYIGSMVADFHRTLLYGGVFLYPNDYSNPKKPKSKLRLLYEVAPMSFIMEQAGGAATTGAQRALDVVPSSLHDRVPIVLGSKQDVELYEKFCAESNAAGAAAQKELR
jgi:fructose-1,6-bisphosphatase I